jgi:hypothetical protein
VKEHRPFTPTTPNIALARCTTKTRKLGEPGRCPSHFAALCRTATLLLEDLFRRVMFEFSDNPDNLHLKGSGWYVLVDTRKIPVT